MHARQAIQTKYCSPTNSRSARVKAWCYAKARFMPCDHGHNPEENHYQAALALAKELNWNTEGHGFGALPGGGYVLTLATS